MNTQIFFYMTYKILALLGLFLVSGYAKVCSQVGINTTDPRKELEVAGTMKVSDSITIAHINALRDGETSTFLMQDQSNYINIMDVSNPTGSALGYIQEYVIENPDLDWVLDFDTLINASQYVVNIISANYDRELTMDTGGVNASIPYSSAFIRNNTWHIIADYPSASNMDSSEIGTWTITTLIYSKDLSKQFGTHPIQMDNQTTGSAASPIIH